MKNPTATAMAARAHESGLCMGNPLDGPCPGTRPTDPAFAHGRCEYCQGLWNLWRQERRADRKAAGRCGTCGSANSNGYSACDACRAQSRAYLAKRRAEARQEHLWALLRALSGRRLRLALWVMAELGYELDATRYGCVTHHIHDEWVVTPMTPAQLEAARAMMAPGAYKYTPSTEWKK